MALNAKGAERAARFSGGVVVVAELANQVARSDAMARIATCRRLRQCGPGVRQVAREWPILLLGPT
jgi:hypothetical protein